MDNEKGRTSRASSTSSLGREVRCACQFFQSDSLLPERRAAMLSSRPSSRLSSREQKPTLSSPVCEHEYEPVGKAIVIPTGPAPVVKITDTDFVPVADSDDSIDYRGRFTPGPVLADVDVVLPLDGRIEDNAMEGKELGSGDTSEEIETAQQLQDRLEEHFLTAATTPCTESRTDAEVNTSQVDSSIVEELPLRRGARGLPQRIKTQAGKFRSRFKSIQRPNFTFPTDRKNKTKKTKTIEQSKSSGKASDSSPSKDESVKMPIKQGRIERIKDYTLAHKPKFNFLQKSKFRLPERPKINLSKLKSTGSFRLPSLPKRNRAPSLGEQRRQYSNESTVGSKKNIFDFSTVPRLFEKKVKGQSDYTTSSPKESRTHSLTTETLPRAKNPRMSFGARWAQRFTDIKYADDDIELSVELEQPWKYGATEQPRLSLQPQESFEESEPLPWEADRKRPRDERVEDSYDDEETKPVPRNTKLIFRDSDESYEPQIDPRLYGDQNIDLEESKKMYKVEFEAVDPQKYQEELSGDEELEVEEEEEVEEFEDDEHLSDREQQSSSGSSCDRRRRGIIDEIDADEYISESERIRQDEMQVRNYLISEIKDLIEQPIDTDVVQGRIIFASSEPPQRPARRKKRKEIQDSYEEFFPIEPKRILTESQEVDDFEDKDSTSESRHKVVYHTDSATYLNDQQEPLDDIVIVKPVRRKSKTSLRSSSLVPSELNGELPLDGFKLPPVAPKRRKRNVQEYKENIPVTVRATSYTDYYTFEREKLPRPQSEPPMKSTRASSQEKANGFDKTHEEYYIESAPVPPKRHSRSRTASIIQDDDRTSRGAESIMDIGLVDNEILLEDELKLGIPGYAVIEKREKVPRPPRRRRSERFATMDRPSPPKRPVRAYSIPRPSSGISREEFVAHPEHESTPYVEIESDEEINDEHRNLLSGEVLDKMARRPLPPPPRPPRFKKDKYSHKDVNGFQDAKDELSFNETFASTQTDPLPDDLVIEEEVTQARLIVTSSTSGSQILVSTERIPSPQHFRINPQAISHDRIPSPVDIPYLGSTTRSEPDIRGSRITPERDGETPFIPPLPTKSYHRGEEEEETDMFTRDKSPHSRGPDDDLIERPASRLINADELEERLSTFLANETLKIGNLEVGDLKVEKISVSTLDAHKISASNIDTDVITAKEISNFDLEKKLSTVHPTLLHELSSIKTQLELVSLQQQQQCQDKESTSLKVDSEFVKQKDLVEDKKISEDIHKFQPSSHQSDYLQLDTVETSNETRAIFSSQGSINPRERYQTLSESELLNKSTSEEEDSSTVKYERSKSRSRSNSPTKSTLKQVASPIRSLPPAISVTPDTPDDNQKPVELKDKKPQRATISYLPNQVESLESQTFSDSISLSQSHQNQQPFIPLQSSQIPAQFFALAVPQSSLPTTDEPGVIDMSQQLIRALRLLGKRAMRHFVNYIVSRVSQDDSEAKVREIELAICALLLIIVGLIIVCFGGPKTITHHHHWDYFNPPRA